MEEREGLFVFLSNPRLAPGHTLVTPKRHVEKLAELSDDERNAIFKAVADYQEKILTRYSTGCDTRLNFRPFLPADNYYKVNHLHVHLVPRSVEDEISQKVQPHERALFAPLPDEELQKFMGILRD